MKLLDLTLPSPAENLACDEALLDWGGNGDGGEILRVLGIAGILCRRRLCEQGGNRGQRRGVPAQKIPVFRRCSGGGTVVQGPGCLNYTLVLQIDEESPARQHLRRQPIHHATQPRGD